MGTEIKTTVHSHVDLLHDIIVILEGDDSIADFTEWYNKNYTDSTRDDFAEIGTIYREIFYNEKW